MSDLEEKSLLQRNEIKELQNIVRKVGTTLDKKEKVARPADTVFDVNTMP